MSSEPYGSKWKRYQVWPRLVKPDGGSIDYIKLNNHTNSSGDDGTPGAQGVQGSTGSSGSGGSGNVPTGGIIMWSGAVANIPTGWALCDGNNNTPDLVDKFIVGVGNFYQPGDEGGSRDSVLVEHTHTATVTDPGHTHDANADGGTTNSNGPNFRREGNNTGDLVTQSATTGITVSNSTEGVSGSDTNLPPYYALAYIIKQ